MAKNIIRGREVTTERERQQMLKNMVLVNLQILNLGVDKIHVVLNKGDEIPIDAGEELGLGDVPIASFEIVEIGAKVKFIGVEY